ncbi:kinase-like domain-containing protein [Fimicolochytrium jonesii]|uniref:kinase-like domain-containing protein n=1 Tax=Fimicolochytrium jonesii TaxID=1396493 RepID=UPI0022FEDDE8|nr:kinase-like domain-containing protein [Fimicolochytrium jonesii]KAI8823665.1 kinase-like domain-containing protein [Fimicolochytrium jonesii]
MRESDMDVIEHLDDQHLLVLQKFPRFSTSDRNGLRPSRIESGHHGDGKHTQWGSPSVGPSETTTPTMLSPILMPTLSNGRRKPSAHFSSDESGSEDEDGLQFTLGHPSTASELSIASHGTESVTASIAALGAPREELMMLLPCGALTSPGGAAAIGMGREAVEKQSGAMSLSRIDEAEREGIASTRDLADSQSKSADNGIASAAGLLENTGLSPKFNLHHHEPATYIFSPAFSTPGRKNTLLQRLFSKPDTVEMPEEIIVGRASQTHAGDADEDEPEKQEGEREEEGDDADVQADGVDHDVETDAKISSTRTSGEEIEKAHSKKEEVHEYIHLLHYPGSLHSDHERPRKHQNKAEQLIGKLLHLKSTAEERGRRAGSLPRSSKPASRTSSVGGEDMASPASLFSSAQPSPTASPRPGDFVQVTVDAGDVISHKPPENGDRSEPSTAKNLFSFLHAPLRSSSVTRNRSTSTSRSRASETEHPRQHELPGSSAAEERSSVTPGNDTPGLPAPSPQPSALSFLHASITKTASPLGRKRSASLTRNGASRADRPPKVFGTGSSHPELPGRPAPTDGTDSEADQSSRPESPLPSPQANAGFFEGEGPHEGKVLEVELEPHSLLTRKSSAKKLGRSASETSMAEKYGVVHKNQVLGKGANAVVRLAHKIDTTAPNPTEVLYAVKEFRKRRKEETHRDYLKKLIAEFCISSNMHHENVIQTVDLIQDERERWCQVMEYMPGGDLFGLLANGSLKEMDERLCIFKQVMSGVQYLHSVGVAHRDLKPENLLLDADERIVKITDFGVSEVFRTCFERAPRKQKGICGSMPYIPPEEWSSPQSYDGSKADIWACGIIFFTLFNRSMPWRVARMGADAHYSRYANYITGVYNPLDKDQINHAAHPDATHGYAPFDKIPPGPRTLLYRLLDPSPQTRWSADQLFQDEWFSRVEACKVGALKHKHGAKQWPAVMV